MKKYILLVTLLIVVFQPIQSVAYTSSIGIEENDEVNMHYALTFDGVLDQEDDFTIVVNNNNLIEGFYLNVLGMKVGEEKSFVVPPDKGYPPSHKLGGKTLYFDVTINEIVSNIRGANYVPPVETESESVFDFAAADVAVQEDSVFQDLVTSPVFLALSITGIIVFAYIKLSGSTDSVVAEKAGSKKSSAKLTAQEKLRKRMAEVEKKEY